MHGFQGGGFITGKRRLRWAGAAEEGIRGVVIRKLLRKPCRQAMGLKGWEVRRTGQPIKIQGSDQGTGQTETETWMRSRFGGRC